MTVHLKNSGVFEFRDGESVEIDSHWLYVLDNTKEILATFQLSEVCGWIGNEAHLDSGVLADGWATKEEKKNEPPT